ncbi:MAG TPA: hypothetical protein PKJ77_08100, partial [Thermodesulfobacteriota bacterium]|nr:hypothetical protein [Thermodesulfobacteriota bacterium]
MEPAFDLRRYHRTLTHLCPVTARGRVTKVVGLVTEAQGLASRLGSMCDIYPKGERRSVRAEVLGFNNDRVLLMPLEEIWGIGPGSLV